MSLARIQLLNAALRCPTAFKENLSVVVVTRDAEVLSDFIKRFNCIGWCKVAATGLQVEEWEVWEEWEAISFSLQSVLYGT